MKKLFLLAVILGIILTGCSSAPASNEAMQEWLEAANLDAEEPPEDLYEKALNEGVLTIYTVSSRIMDVAESFEQAYPGLQVDVIYTRAEELVGQITTEASNKSYACDLIFCTNGDGSLTENLIPEGLVYKYLPWDIEDAMRSGGNEQYLSILLEVPLLAYNEEVYPAPPVSNWWELTEPQWKDQVYITNPARSMISYTLFSTMQKNEDQMAAAYEQRYGVPFEQTNGEGAFQTFLRKLVENGLHVVNDSDDVADAIGKPGMDSRGIGILNASKIRLRESGYPLAVSYEMEPFAGVINPANMMIVGGSKNINAAKLFIRWTLGETDGSGTGYKPFLQKGAWPARTDVDSPSRPLDSFQAIYTDEQFACQNREDFLTLWESLMETSE